MRIAEQLTHHQPSGWLEHTCQLTQRRRLIGNLTQGGGQEGGVEAVVLIRQLLGVALAPGDVVDALALRPAQRVVEHLLLQVEDLEHAIGRDPPGDGKAVVTGPRPDLENALSGRGRESLAQPASGDERMRCFHP